MSITRSFLCALPLFGGVVAFSAMGQTAQRGGYVVAIDSESAKHPAWTRVAQALCEKHSGRIEVYPKGNVDTLLPQLRKSAPRHVCFVSAPECVGRELVVGAAQLIRRIDDDPFGDALWGIVTGYDAADALRMASHSEPFVVRNAATSMGGVGFFKEWDGGFASDEGNRNRFWVKGQDGQAICRHVEPDQAESLADAFNTISVDYWCTSGHASERNWQIVYNQNAGFIVHKNGFLYSRDTSGALFPILSLNPKVYVAAGNCLIGHIDKQDCMTTAWMHSGGVSQMVGYTVVTFYGFMGWGVKSLFESGRHSLAEAFFLNNQILLWKLNRLNPKLRDRRIDPKGKFSTREMIVSMNGIVKTKDELGLFWDRDTVAFYGDPAWDVRCPEKRRDIDVAIDGRNITVRFLREVKFPDSIDSKDMRPVGVLLSTPSSGSSIVSANSGAALDGAVVTDFFALMPITGTHAKGETLKFRFE